MMTQRLSIRRSTPLVALLAALAVSMLAVVAGVSPVSAHDATDGSTVVAVDSRRVIITASVPFADLGYLDTSGDGLIDSEELADQEADVAPTLVGNAREHVELTVDGEPAEIIGAGVPTPSETGADDAGGSSYAMLVLASGPHDGEVTEVEVDWRFDGPSTNIVLSHPDGAVTGELGDDGTASFSLGAVSSATSFFKLGIDHIRFGPDHLLFLLVLTLAVAGTTITTQTARRTVKLVTAFTLGHAVSLGLAYFELVSVPAWVVEPAISLSIVAAAVLAIRGRARDARPWIAALVGLIHGLGFASSLGGLGVATSQRLLALGAFNLGIDIAQTLFVLLVVAALWLFSLVLDQRVVWVRTAAATGCAVFGVLWTASRLADLPI
ncbi:HupE/UreJ family protein [Ilumatobacter sp.]|uniref:HupE/UreJ family protein n=1 Tax=Ilumatobacter sp. TaxID=1967498 RepID=UPI003C3672CD